MKLALALIVSSFASAAVPTPESVLGHKPGDDFYLASYDDSLSYFQKLAASTNKLKLVSAGKTSQGRDWYFAIISSPSNLDQLDKYKSIARRLAHPEGLTGAEARALARDGKAIVHIDGGLHATEVAHAQHTIQLAYDLVSNDSDAKIAAILDNVILVLWFSINPDGQNMVVNWYRKNLGTSYEVSPLPELYQEYIGHDNNRDGYMNNMPESQVITRTTLEWNPQVVYNHHQTAPFPARIWIPPFAEPISSNVHPLMWRWVNVFGTAMAAYLDQHGMPGAMHRGRFDDWYPGFLDHVNSFRNSVSFLTETALYRYATPHFYTVDEFPKEKQELRSEVFYASPWRGGWWRLGDAVRYMVGASVSVLDTTAKNREDLLYNRYQAGRDVIERFRKEPPFAYVIPQRQHDPPAAALLIGKLMLAGIEVRQASQTFRANGMEYPAGAWVVLMDQPFAGLVKDLFEVQRYPAAVNAGGGGAELPYDVTGWTLPMQMGVETAAVTTPVGADARAALQRLDAAPRITGKLEGAGPAWSISRETNAAVRAVNLILEAGGRVAIAKEDRSFVIADLDRAKLEPILSAEGVNAKALKAAPTGAYPVKAPRVGLYRPWMASIDEGWTRWILEQYKFRLTSLRNADIQAGHLKDRFDAILLADMPARVLNEGYLAGTIPGQYAGGLGDSGAESLRDFVREGGTLIAFNNSTTWVIEKLQLPVTNVLAGLKNEQFFCSGALLRVEVKEAAHPVMAGLPAEPAVMFERGPAFDTKASFKGKVLAAYPKDRNPLASGFLLHPERIQGKAAALDVEFGKGRVILLGFRPQWRGQSHGTYKFFLNALYYSAAMAPEEKPAEPPAAPQASQWKTLTAGMRGDLALLLEANKAYYAAKGPKAVEEGKKLEAALDTFQKNRISALDSFREGLDDRSAARKVSEYAGQWRKLIDDVRTKDLSDRKPADVPDEYRLEALEGEVAALLAKATK
jgi:hypothetical protein